MIDKNDSPIIWYIPGFLSGDNPQNAMYYLLKTIYSDAQNIKNIVWENQRVSVLDFVAQAVETTTANTLTLLSAIVSYIDDPSEPAIIPTPVKFASRWIKALNDIDPTAILLAKKISILPSRERQKLILIGHSLGGNIVIRTLAHLSQHNCSIHSAVLLGAAISNTDENIPLATNATIEPIHSMINPNDEALKDYQMVTGNLALGRTGCTLSGDHKNFREHCTAYSTEHSSEYYLAQWASYLQKLSNLRSRYQSKNHKRQIFKRRNY